MSDKTTKLEKAKEKAKARKAERRERWANRFPFNMLNDMWRGITGQPR